MEDLKALISKWRATAMQSANAMNALCGGKGFSEKAASLSECAGELETILEQRIASKEVEPIQLFICEIPRLTLKPGHIYIFGVDPECEECATYLSGSLLSKESGEAQAVASAVHSAIRMVRQDVRPYMRHLGDCDLVKFRNGYYSPSETKSPPCSCGLEKILWDIPARTETGKTGK